MANLFPDLFGSKRSGLAVLQKISIPTGSIFAQKPLLPNPTMYCQRNKNDQADRKTHKKKSDHESNQPKQKLPYLTNPHLYEEYSQMDDM